MDTARRFLLSVCLRNTCCRLSSQRSTENLQQQAGGSTDLTPTTDMLQIFSSPTVSGNNTEYERWSHVSMTCGHLNLIIPTLLYLQQSTLFFMGMTFGIGSYILSLLMLVSPFDDDQHDKLLR